MLPYLKDKVLVEVRGDDVLGEREEQLVRACLEAVERVCLLYCLHGTLNGNADDESGDYFDVEREDLEETRRHRDVFPLFRV